MEHSDELRDLTLRFYEAEATGDLSFIERYVSRQDGAVYVGSDPNEWWEGFEAFVEAIRAQSEAMGRSPSSQGPLPTGGAPSCWRPIKRNREVRLPLTRASLPPVAAST